MSFRVVECGSLVNEEIPELARPQLLLFIDVEEPETILTEPVNMS